MTAAARLAGLLGTRFGRGFVLVDRDRGTTTIGLGKGTGGDTDRSAVPAVEVLPFDPADRRDPGPWGPPPRTASPWVATVPRGAGVPRWSGAEGPPVPDPGMPPVPGPARLELPPRDRVVESVGEVLRAIRAGRAEKIVPSVGARLVFPDPPPPGALAAALVSSRAGGPDGRTRFALLAEGRLLVGATPERLFRLAPDGRLETEALAGTGTPGEEERLLASPKDREEHELVVRGIRESLAPLVEELEGPPEPAIRHLPGLVHLRTPLGGRVRPGVTAVDVLRALHPTPAVAGTPRDAALAWLRDREAPRGAFAAPLVVTWPDGTVEAFVVLRAAVLEGPVLHLRAGAGIVADSDPAREADEILAKLRATVAGLGLPLPAETTHR